MGLAGEVHMAAPDGASKARLRAATIDQTASLSRYPNVSVKLSSAPAYSSEGFPFRDMASHIRRLVDAYGPRRCYWGTDLTKAIATVPYRDHLGYLAEALTSLSEDDRDWIMGRAVLTRLGWAP
jgi:predicted TIM-barrel fold metal-dependent hydrolase